MSRSGVTHAGTPFWRCMRISGSRAEGDAVASAVAVESASIAQPTDAAQRSAERALREAGPTCTPQNKARCMVGIFQEGIESDPRSLQARRAPGSFAYPRFFSGAARRAARHPHFIFLFGQVVPVSCGRCAIAVTGKAKAMPVVLVHQLSGQSSKALESALPDVWNSPSDVPFFA